MEVFRAISRIFWMTFLFATSFAYKGVDDCPRWYPRPGTVMTYQGTCYFFYMKDALTFPEARRFCWRKGGGSLVMPKTKTISDFLEKQIKSFKPEVGTWIGLNQDVTRNVTRFSWLDGEAVKPEFAQKVLQYGTSVIYDYKHIKLEYHNGGSLKHFVCEIIDTRSTTPSTTTTTTTTTPSTTTTTTATTTSATTTIQIGPRPIPTIEKYLCPSLPTGQQFMRFFGNVCFYFNVKWVSYYDESKSFCERHGGTLALIKDPIIETFLQYTLRHGFNVPNYLVWIGLESTSSGNGPKYRWADGTPATYDNFRYSFPVGTRFAMSGVGDNKWMSYPKNTAMNSICQFKSISSIPPSQCGR